MYKNQSGKNRLHIYDMPKHSTRVTLLAMLQHDHSTILSPGHKLQSV